MGMGDAPRRGSGVQRARARAARRSHDNGHLPCLPVKVRKVNSAANNSTMGDAVNLATTVHAFNKILAQPKLSSRTRTPEDVEESVKKLRRLILIEGIPSRAVCARFTVADPCTLFVHPPGSLQDPTLRYRIWKILLRVNDLPAETFLEYVARGPCEVREKIRNDTFRCVATCLIAESSPLMWLFVAIFVQYISY
jgi:hypothetical protein